MSINVGQWIAGNSRHLTQSLSPGLLHPTLLTKLFAANGLDTTGEEVLQLKAESGGDGSGASSSGAGSSQQAKLTKTRATIFDLARAVDQ